MNKSYFIVKWEFLEILGKAKFRKGFESILSWYVKVKRELLSKVLELLDSIDGYIVIDLEYIILVYSAHCFLSYFLARSNKL